MTTKLQKKPAATNPSAPVKPNPSAVVVQVRKTDTVEDARARTLMRPAVQSAATIQKFEGDNLDVNAVVRELGEQVDAVNSGDMRRPEAMLVAQAHSLDALFNNLARRAHGNMIAGYGDAAERYLRLALKAQGQCRATLEALAEIKSPRAVAFVRQANIAHGPQQVNNGQPSRTWETETEPNKLSGGSNELLPDTRALQAASGIDTQVGALAALDRAEVAGR